MSESELYQKGREIRRQLMGDAMVEDMAKNTYTNPTMEKFSQFTSEAVFGMLWGRPSLDLKLRTLICVISDTIGICVKLFFWIYWKRIFQIWHAISIFIRI